MKLYDFDGMFDEKLGEYIKKNAGKHRESEWEDIIPVLYKKFGNTVIKSLGKTPNEFYGEMSDDELIKCLKGHLKQGVPVSEFLCSAIESRSLADKLLPLLDGTDSEREYAMNLMGSDERAIGKYMDILVTSDDSDLKDRCVDYIKEKADLVVECALENYKNGVEKEYMLEILSRSVIKKDEIFDILLKEFRTDADNIPMHASYLAAYGDERAIEYLLDKIDEEWITFVEFQELKFAIEALGGQYTKKRDFSNDPYYELIKSHSVSAFDLFGNLKKDD
ncbi:MAG: hypothetical protein J1G07_04335 [Clostridiales bacterium]|nr:hypothetical protein [Clostridiales bacterium]